jgi:phospholipid-binding lipoprotein MlaA
MTGWREHPARLLRWGVLCLLCAGLWGCAGAPKNDPLEPMNRKIFEFNDAVDKAVVAPVARTYRDVVPSPVRTGFTNFFGNFSDAWSGINSFLQFKLEDGFRTAMRVSVNTFFGLGGFLDVASEMGIDASDEDLGQTLGRWGMGPGPYLVLPILGPSDVRDTLALPIDLQATPNVFVSEVAARNTLTGVRLVNTRSNLLGATSVLEQAALDPYLFTRDAFLQRRRSLVYDGNPPSQDEEEGEGDEVEPDEPSEPAKPQSEGQPAPAPAAPASVAAPAGSASSPVPAEAASAPQQK